MLAHLSDLYASVPPFCRPEGLSGRLVGLLFQPRRVCLILGCQAGWLLAPVVSFRNSRTACFVLRNSSAVDLASCSLLLRYRMVRGRILHEVCGSINLFRPIFVSVFPHA